MTQEQLYSEYLVWLGGLSPLPCSRIFQFPLTNQDVFEDASSVVNRICFVIPHMAGDGLRLFAFFQENSFLKDPNGDLTLVGSAFFIPKT